MIKNNCIEIEDDDGDALKFERGSMDDGFFVVDENGTNILFIADADAVGLVQFLKRYGVSA